MRNIMPLYSEETFRKRWIIGLDKKCIHWQVDTVRLNHGAKNSISHAGVISQLFSHREHVIK
jgi:hypothetical protein